MSHRSRHSVRSCQLAVFAFILSVLLVTNAVGQGGVATGPINDSRNDTARMNSYTAYSTSAGTGVVLITVYSENTRVPLDRQALLKLRSDANQTATWQTTEEGAHGVFTNIAYGGYNLEVSAVGYLTAQKELQVMSQVRPVELQIVLQKDPAAIDLDVSDAMPAKARKDTKRAVSALKSGNLQEAQKRLDVAYKLVPSSPELNFLLGYLYFQKKDYPQAGTYLGAATNLKPHDVQALTLLGRVSLERQDYPAARSALEQAVAADAENWLPRNLLADSYLKERNFQKAREEAEAAISKGKNKAAPAQLVLGQALVGLGHDQEGIRALTVFLDDSPHNPMAKQVRSLISEIQQRDSSPPDPSKASTVATPVSGVDPLLALAEPGLSVKNWQPAGIDDLKPSLAAGVVCPSEKVIEASGQRVQQLVDDVSRIAAVEDLLHQSLDEMGNPIRTETRKFNYVASFAEVEPGVIAVNEYRADRLDLKGYPDEIASTGFTALALVFHPHMRDNFEMTCEGLGGWHGQATWLVHFRQHDDRPSRIHSYKIGNVVYPVRLKGRAWITADKFQIVRIESELVNPMPDIRLHSEHQIVEYGPIPLGKKSEELWLPKSAEIYFDFRKHRYHRRHSFDHYMLFSVDSDEKRKEPKASPDPAVPTAPPS
jgi:tetratricopeptide (TPR) repeat protein